MGKRWCGEEEGERGLLPKIFDKSVIAPVAMQAHNITVPFYSTKSIQSPPPNTLITFYKYFTAGANHVVLAVVLLVFLAGEVGTGRR